MQRLKTWQHTHRQKRKHDTTNLNVPTNLKPCETQNTMTKNIIDMNDINYTSQQNFHARRKIENTDYPLIIQDTRGITFMTRWNTPNPPTQTLTVKYISYNIYI